MALAKKYAGRALRDRSATRALVLGLLALPFGILSPFAIVAGTRLAVTGASEFESPVEVRMKGRRSSVPLGLARAIFVAEDRA